MTVITSQLFPQQQFFDLTAQQLSGGWVHSYTSGVPLSLYSDRNALTPLPNPFELDSAGKVPLGIRGVGTYDIEIRDSTDTTAYYNFEGVQLGYGATLAVSLGNLSVTANTWSTTSGNDIIFQTALTGAYKINGTSLSSGTIYFYEDTDNGLNYISLKAPSLISSNKAVTLPDSDVTTLQSQMNKSETGAFTEFVDTVSSSSVADTVYTSAESYLFLTRTFTPKSSTSILKIEVSVSLVSTSNNGLGTDPQRKQGMFLMTGANAIAGVVRGRSITSGNAPCSNPLRLTHYMTSGTTSEITFSVYGKGFNAGTAQNRFDINGVLASRKLGGVSASTISITEYPT